MNLRHLTARTAVAGISTVLAAGALVGVTGTAANAATVTNTYTCSIPTLYSGDFALPSRAACRCRSTGPARACRRACST
jgi:hypothetical protein